ncbi:MAG: hypothetical protein SFX18_02920 [Pirellulales bacterium]|nr:hypothetical protein [Pirellulales bacterium]
MCSTKELIAMGLLLGLGLVACGGCQQQATATSEPHPAVTALQDAAADARIQPLSEESIAPAEFPDSPPFPDPQAGLLTSEQLPPPVTASDAGDMTENPSLAEQQYPLGKNLGTAPPQPQFPSLPFPALISHSEAPQLLPAVNPVEPPLALPQPAIEIPSLR